MPDIAMCTNKKCPSRLKCHRFTAQPSGWQSYTTYTVPKGKKKCESFYDNKGLRRDQPW